MSGNQSGTGFKSVVDLTNYLFSSRKTIMENAQTWNRGNVEGITKWNECQSIPMKVMSSTQPWVLKKHIKYTDKALPRAPETGEGRSMGKGGRTGGKGQPPGPGTQCLQLLPGTPCHTGTRPCPQVTS